MAKTPKENKSILYGQRQLTCRYHSKNTLDLIETHGQSKLLKVVPNPNYTINSTSYEPAIELDWLWYQTLTSLSENVTNSRKRARKHGFDFNIKLLDLVTLWLDQKGLCALTGTELDTQSGSLDDKNPRRASVDRIDSGKGYTKDNIRLLCHWANNAKSTYDDDLFITMCRSATAVNSTCV